MILANNLSFTGVKQLRQDADWICRNVRSTFPAISPNRLYYENPTLIKNNERFYNFIFKKAKILKQDRQDRKFLHNPFKILKEIIYSAQEHKVAHCCEYSSLAEMVARMNGIKNCYQLFMKDYDHTFLLVKKNPIDEGIMMDDIVIDPWLGLSGRLQDMKLKYKNMFNMDNANIAFKIKQSLSLSSDEINYLKAQFPQFVFKGRDGRKLMDFNHK